MSLYRRACAGASHRNCFDFIFFSATATRRAHGAGKSRICGRAASGKGTHVQNDDALLRKGPQWESRTTGESFPPGQEQTNKIQCSAPTLPKGCSVKFSSLPPSFGMTTLFGSSGPRRAGQKCDCFCRLKPFETVFSYFDLKSQGPSPRHICPLGRVVNLIDVGPFSHYPMRSYVLPCLVFTHAHHRRHRRLNAFVFISPFPFHLPPESNATESRLLHFIFTHIVPAQCTRTAPRTAKCERDHVEIFSPIVFFPFRDPPSLLSFRE